MPAPIYTFTLVSFQVFNTRSRHQDTDYVAFSLDVAGQKSKILTKSMGDLGNGVYPTNLVFDGISVGAKQAVVATYLIINAGSVSASTAMAELGAAAQQLVEAGIEGATKDIAANQPDEGTWETVGNVIGNIVGDVTVPVLASALGAFVGWVFGKVAGLINPNCDGLVAAEVIPFSGDGLWVKTAAGAVEKSTNHLGPGSPDGCQTSNYTVTWSIGRSVRPPVSAIFNGSGQTELFAIGDGNRVFTISKDPAKGWGNWTNVSIGTFTLGTQVTTLLDSVGTTHLFAVGEDGHVYTSTSGPSFGWVEWSAVRNGNFPQCTTISALYDSPNSTIHLFAVDKNGHVCTASSLPADGWNGYGAAGWDEVSNGVFTLGTTVTSLIDKPGQIQLFAVGTDGRVFSAWKDPGKNWAGWANVSSQAFSQGTTVTALFDGAGQTQLFAIGKDNHVWTTGKDPAKGWAEWSIITSGTFAQGTEISSLIDGAGQIQLFAVGQDDRMYTAWKDPGKSWAGWATVSNGTFNQGTIVSSLIDKAGQVQLFAVGQSGFVNNAWKDPGKDWAGWATVSSSNGLNPFIPLPNL